MGKINFDEDIITLEELSKRIGVSIDTVEKWRGKGLPTIKIDKYVRFYWPKVLQWIIGQEEEVNDEKNEGN
jgi:phage terminase Nu1 subunit (DNA packaging protein)